MSAKRCKEQVSGGGRYGAFNMTSCTRKAVTESGFCKQHDPESRAVKQAEKETRWQAEWTARGLAAERQNRILKACEGMDAEQVIHAINEWKALYAK